MFILLSRCSKGIQSVGPGVCLDFSLKGLSLVGTFLYLYLNLIFLMPLFFCRTVCVHQHHSRCHCEAPRGIAGFYSSGGVVYMMTGIGFVLANQGNNLHRGRVREGDMPPPARSAEAFSALIQKRMFPYSFRAGLELPYTLCK